jgi:hypothetical protein
MAADRALLDGHYAGGWRALAEPSDASVGAALDAALDGTLAVAPDALAAVRRDHGRCAGARRLAALLDDLVAGSPGAAAS